MSTHNLSFHRVMYIRKILCGYPYLPGAIDKYLLERGRGGVVVEGIWNSYMYVFVCLIWA